MGQGPLSGRRGAGAQVPGAGDAGRAAAGVTGELLDRRAAVAELGAELRALADLVTRTEAGADVLRECARRLREVAPALRERIRGSAEPASPSGPDPAGSRSCGHPCPRFRPPRESSSA